MKDYSYHRSNQCLKNKFSPFYFVIENSYFYTLQHQDPSLPFNYFFSSTESLVLLYTYPCIKFPGGSAWVVEGVCQRPLGGGIGETMLLGAVHHGNDGDAQTHTLGYHGEVGEMHDESQPIAQ